MSEFQKVQDLLYYFTSKSEANLSLPYLISLLNATTLEDTLTQLRMLAETNNELRIQKAWIDMPLLRALKYTVEQPPITDPEGMYHPNISGVENKLKKLESDRNMVTSVIEDIYSDLSVNRSFSPLIAKIKQILAKDYYREHLILDEAKNKSNRRDLYKQLRQQRNHIKTMLYDTNATIDDLKTQVEDSQLYTECRSRYVDNWQRARTEQHIQSIRNWEKGPSETIEYYKQRFDYEQRIHSEVEMLINIAINETLEKVESWMNKYDKDMEGLDLKIQIKKNEYQNQLDKRINLENTIEKHDTMMKEWIHFKEEREKARLYREKMTNAAICVQAWWRGLLVRRQLGPYKVAKKKGGADKGKKK